MKSNSAMKLKENSTIKIITGGEAKVLKELGAGGQGTVYKVHYGGKDYALKWYHKPGKQEFYDNLKHNIDKGSPSSAFLWPLFLTEKDSEGCYGYLMELRDPAYREFCDFLLAKVKFQSVEAMIEAGINICYGFRRLHSAGYSYQDLNDGNFFINPANGDVLICDNDNVAPPGTKTGILGKCRYMAPEVVMRKSDPNPQSDRFSLAVILFLLLFNNHPLEGEQVVKYACLTEKNEKVFFGSHPVFIYDPQDVSNRPVPGIHVNVLSLWKQYPDYVRTLFQDQFSQDALHDPSRRITEKEWLNELLLPLRHDLIRCPRCGNEIFARITAQSSTFICEDCGSTLQRPRLIQVGHYKVVPCPDKKIYQYITDSNKPKLRTCTAQVVESKKTPGLFGLRNLTTGTWMLTTKSGATRPIAPQQAAPLLIGNTLSFGNGTEAKIV